MVDWTPDVEEKVKRLHKVCVGFDTFGETLVMMMTVLLGLCNSHDMSAEDLKDYFDLGLKSYIEKRQAD